jgi:ribulose 1,5-bisphosphate carboxylase large subunit-like protein
MLFVDMEGDVHGFVFHATRHANGNIEIGFYDKDKDSAVTYSTKPKEGQLTKELARALADTIAQNIWVKIHLNKKGKITKVSTEEYDFEKDIYRLKEKLRRIVVTGS